ncbi:hypothetical protein MBLNU13_g11177t1 [Cladosporium sp. NU13]
MANLDAPENREVVEEMLEEIQSNVQREIRDISTEARDLRGVSTVGRTADNTIFTTTRAVRICVAELARYIFTTAQSAPSKFHAESAEVTHRMVIIAIICEALADIDNIGGYFNCQLNPKTTNPEQSLTHDDPRHEESPLFMEQDEDLDTRAHDALGGASDVSGEGGNSDSPMDTTADDEKARDDVYHQRTESASSDSGFSNTQELGMLVENARGNEEAGDHPSVQETDEERQLALSATQAPIPMRGRRLLSRAARDYEADKKRLRRKLANRRRTELNICQGNCFNDLEEADHRNWEKGQEIDSLKASVAGLQSQVEVLNGVVTVRDREYKERCEENIQLKARIQELELQARKGKTVRFATGTN